VIRRLLAAIPVLLAAAACTGGAPAAPVPPTIAVTRPAVTAPTTPAVTAVPTLAPAPRESFRALVAQWQAARSAFLSLVTSGRPLTLAAEHAAASAFLAAERQFAAALSPAASWPAAARPALAALRGVSAQMQSHLVAMARADSRSTFTERLADYSVDTARDNAAIRTVDQILAR
jgi:hypothetical protein